LEGWLPSVRFIPSIEVPERAALVGRNEFGAVVA
jgi:hypothetical protein